MRGRFLLLLFLLWAPLPAEASCPPAFARFTQAPSELTPAQKKKALAVMLSGSQKASRTVALGRRFIAPRDVPDSAISGIAEKNFVAAATYVVENSAHLPINQETAVKLNRMLTEGLVPEADRGRFDFRLRGPYVHETDSFVAGSPEKLYRWLESAEAQKMQTTDPVGFAEILHNNLVALDSFPDGNGRLSRLFSDLALLRAGRGPASYTDMRDYFARGNARAEVSRQARQAYYREIAESGDQAVRGSGIGVTR